LLKIVANVMRIIDDDHVRAVTSEVGVERGHKTRPPAVVPKSVTSVWPRRV
jgi:hypothetical protein